MLCRSALMRSRGSKHERMIEISTLLPPAQRFGVHARVVEALQLVGPSTWRRPTRISLFKGEFERSSASIKREERVRRNAEWVIEPVVPWRRQCIRPNFEASSVRPGHERPVARDDQRLGAP